MKLSMQSMKVPQVLLICFVFAISACGGTSFRNRVCEPLKTIPKELDGTYNYAMPRDSLELSGYYVATPQLVTFSSKENILVSHSIKGNDFKLVNPVSRTAMDSIEDVEFCRDSKDALWLQRFDEETHTWSVASIDLQENGFSIQELSFPLQSLADMGFRYLVVDSSWESFQGSMSTLGGTDIIVDNSKTPQTDIKGVDALLSLGKPSAVMIYFARVPPTLELQKRLTQNGKKFFYGKKVK